MVSPRGTKPFLALALALAFALTFIAIGISGQGQGVVSTSGWRCFVSP